ncbi:MAG: hypothetical protein ACE5FA_13220, partial [Dehalococcoidia bacterium]
MSRVHASLGFVTVLVLSASWNLLAQGSWTIETVDSSGDVGRWSSLDLDSGGEPHIGCYDVTNKDVVYAVRSGGSWSIETVESAGDVGQYTSLDLDDVDTPHLCYRLEGS